MAGFTGGELRVNALLAVQLNFYIVKIGFCQHRALIDVNGVRSVDFFQLASYLIEMLEAITVILVFQSMYDGLELTGIFLLECASTF